MSDEMNSISKSDIDDFLSFTEDNKENYRSLDMLSRYDLSYRQCTMEEEIGEILLQLKRIKSDTQIVGTAERTNIWENGWSENLDKFEQTGSIDALAPLYFRKGCPSRLRSHFVYPSDYLFDYHLEKVLKGCLFEKFITHYDNVYEFGCGTCADLYDLHMLFPEKNLYARDLTKAAVEIATMLKDKFDVNIVDACQFDFTKPDSNMHIERNSAVYTFSALEQIDDKYGLFIQYLIDEKPDVVVHLEPMNEVYDDNNIVDWCAKEFHEKRHYLNNFLTYMRELEDENIIEIVYFRRTKVGGWNHESNTVLVWRPC